MRRVALLAVLGACSRAEPLPRPTCPPEMQTVWQPNRGSFCVDRFEVTAAAYRECIAAGACSLVSWPDRVLPRACSVERIDYSGYPADCLSPEQADVFCAWKKKRLPTAAEWMWVATNGVGAGYPWGGTDVVSWWRNACSNRPYDTCEVGASPDDVTRLGVFDMAGNVSEWARDKTGAYQLCGANAASVSVSAGIQNVCYPRWPGYQPGILEGVRCFSDPSP